MTAQWALLWLLPCFTVPSFMKHTLQVTWTCVVTSFLHEVKNPHTTGSLRWTHQGQAPCGVTPPVLRVTDADPAPLFSSHISVALVLGLCRPLRTTGVDSRNTQT